jgi:hypothetical protein
LIGVDYQPVASHWQTLSHKVAHRCCRYLMNYLVRLVAPKWNSHRFYYHEDQKFQQKSLYLCLTPTVAIFQLHKCDCPLKCSL